MALSSQTMPEVQNINIDDKGTCCYFWVFMLGEGLDKLHNAHLYWTMARGSMCVSYSKCGKVIMMNNVQYFLSCCAVKKCNSFIFK